MGEYFLTSDMAIRLFYLYLLGWVAVAVYTAVKIGTLIDQSDKPLHPILNIIYLMIFCLIFIQGYQCLLLVFGPIGKLWWVPLFCKHSSLIIYVIFLKFIHFRHEIDCKASTDQGAS